MLLLHANVQCTACCAAGEAPDYSADKVKSSVHESLKRLGVDYIDIVHCHDIEFCTDMRQVGNLAAAWHGGLIHCLHIANLPLVLPMSCSCWPLLVRSLPIWQLGYSMVGKWCRLAHVKQQNQQSSKKFHQLRAVSSIWTLIALNAEAACLLVNQTGSINDSSLQGSQPVVQCKLAESATLLQLS